ncbi:MAG TPA: hypothetical protein VFW60_01020 [Rhodanobacteraceae bacterium]|nr:hypothetical protein [Rhodanobacteraceae bacterium]
MGQELGKSKAKRPAADAPGECATVPNCSMQRNGAIYIYRISVIYIRNLKLDITLGGTVRAAGKSAPRRIRRQPTVMQNPPCDPSQFSV